MEEIMRKRQKERDDAYEAQWDGGRGSHHPDYDPYAVGEDVHKASRETEELYAAVVKNDIKARPPGSRRQEAPAQPGAALQAPQWRRRCTASWRRVQTPTLCSGARTRAGRATRP